MADKKTNPAMEFLLEVLKNDKDAVYKDAAEAAAKKKLKVFPIMWGKAKVILGHVKAAPRGQGKAAKAKAKAAKVAGTAPVAKRGPGRPPKAAASAFTGSLEGIIAAVKDSEQAKTRYRQAVAKIQSILADVLG
ncbi:MAG: hypothetical protein JNK15_16400 [Planctomycetes bacterium]|nr:hypothetical protein [Planctomycetota bacterium]